VIFIIQNASFKYHIFNAWGRPVMTAVFSKFWRNNKICCGWRLYTVTAKTLRSHSHLGSTAKSDHHQTQTNWAANRFTSDIPVSIWQQTITTTQRCLPKYMEGKLQLFSEDRSMIEHNSASKTTWLFRNQDKLRFFTEVLQLTRFQPQSGRHVRCSSGIYSA